MAGTGHVFSGGARSQQVLGGGAHAHSATAVVGVLPEGDAPFPRGGAGGATAASGPRGPRSCRRRTLLARCLRFWASLSFEEGGVLSEFRRCSDWPSGSVGVSFGVLVGDGELRASFYSAVLLLLGLFLKRPSFSSSDGWTSVDSSRFSTLRKDFKRREDSQKSTISSRTAAVFELPIRSGRNTPHPHLKPPSPPPQPPAPPSSPALGAVVEHGGMLAGWSLVGVRVVKETRKQTTVARG
ncbi:uncharacterized protein [Vicugna pacos]|uniref:Uncharacterized protein n=1 Tax=Vicugna pacos TaxID=30538 RepID=A0ABM5CYL6_VICPA